jgi:cell division protein FtsI/penicillin-binding protein 2
LKNIATGAAERGSLYLYGALALFIIVFAGAAVFTYKHAIVRAEKAEQAAREEMALRVQKEAEIAIINTLNDAKIEALKIVAEAQTENKVDAARRKEKASANQVSETSLRDAKKYEGFVRRVMPKNLDLLECRSNMGSRNEKDCLGRIH